MKTGKKRMACLLAVMLLFLLVVPAMPSVTAWAAAENPITKLGIKKLPEGNTIKVGDTFKFSSDIIATAKKKGKTTGIVWWEVKDKTNTAGVSSSRQGYVYPVYEGKFEIRALAFANTKDLEAWKAARSANRNVADEAAMEDYVTAMTDWVKISVVSDIKGYAVARTQYQLGLALKNSKATDIHIKTDKAVRFTIGAKDYTKRTLTIDAPNAEVENAGRFAQINIKQIKESAFKEKAAGNKIYITAPNIKLILTKNAKGSRVLFKPEEDGEEHRIAILDEGGGLEVLDIAAAASAEISSAGISQEENHAVMVHIAEGAASSIQADTALMVSAEADVTLNLSGNAGETMVTKIRDVDVVLSKESTVEKIIAANLHDDIMEIIRPEGLVLEPPVITIGEIPDVMYLGDILKVKFTSDRPVYFYVRNASAEESGEKVTEWTAQITENGRYFWRASVDKDFGEEGSVSGVLVVRCFRVLTAEDLEDFLSRNEQSAETSEEFE